MEGSACGTARAEDVADAYEKREDYSQAPEPWLPADTTVSGSVLSGHSRALLASCQVKHIFETFNSFRNQLLSA